jgi:hypothetical protein
MALGAHDGQHGIGEFPRAEQIGFKLLAHGLTVNVFHAPGWPKPALLNRASSRPPVWLSTCCKAPWMEVLSVTSSWAFQPFGL